MTFDTFLFDDDEQSSMMNIYDDIEPFAAFSLAPGPSPQPFSVLNSMDLGVDKLKAMAHATLQPQPQMAQFAAVPAQTAVDFQPQKTLKKVAVTKSKKAAAKVTSSEDSDNDEFESDLPDSQSRKRRRKASAEEMREKNRLYAKNHRAEKKRRQEELLKRNEQLEKENRHLRRMLMQLGISPSAGGSNASPNTGGFKPVKSIKNVGNSLMKGVKGGFGFMMPNSGKPVQVPQGAAMLAPAPFQLAAPMPMQVQGAPQFIIPPQPIVIQAPLQMAQQPKAE